MPSRKCYRYFFCLLNECTKLITFSVNYEVCHDNCGFHPSKICVARQICITLLAVRSHFMILRTCLPALEERQPHTSLTLSSRLCLQVMLPHFQEIEEVLSQWTLPFSKVNLIFLAEELLSVCKDMLFSPPQTDCDSFPLEELILREGCIKAQGTLKHDCSFPWVQFYIN